MDAPDLTALSAAEIVARVHDGRTSAVAVARAHLARIAERDRHLGAFQEHDPERVLAEAGAVDRRADRFALPLAGVPVAIKDCVDVAGYPTRHGSAATSTPRPPAATTSWSSACARPGAVVIGKTRMPELAIWGFTHSALGTTRNPLDPALDPGGSSGGAAAAVAAGMAALALGTDGGGLDPHPGGVLRAGRGQAGPGRRPAAGRRGRALVRAVGGGPARPHRRGRRAACWACSPGGRSRSTRPGRCTWRCRCARRCRSRGRTPTTGPPRWAPPPGSAPAPAGPRSRSPTRPTRARWGSPGRRRWHAGVAQDAEDLALDLPPSSAARPRWCGAGGGCCGSARPARPALAAWRDRVLEWFDAGGYDVLVSPATARPPVAAGALAGRGYRATFARSAWRMPYTQAWNLAGLPAVVAPVRIGGRPVGVQLVGRPGAESALLSAAATLEQRVVPMAGAAPRRMYV